MNSPKSQLGAAKSEMDILESSLAQVALLYYSPIGEDKDLEREPKVARAYALNKFQIALRAKVQGEVLGAPEIERSELKLDEEIPLFTDIAEWLEYFSSYYELDVLNTLVDSFFHELHELDLFERQLEPRMRTGIPHSKKYEMKTSLFMQLSDDQNKRLFRDNEFKRKVENLLAHVANGSHKVKEIAKFQMDGPPEFQSLEEWFFYYAQVYNANDVRLFMFEAFREQKVIFLRNYVRQNSTVSDYDWTKICRQFPILAKYRSEFNEVLFEYTIARIMKFAVNKRYEKLYHGEEVLIKAEHLAKISSPMTDKSGMLLSTTFSYRTKKGDITYAAKDEDTVYVHTVYSKVIQRIRAVQRQR